MVGFVIKRKLTGVVLSVELCLILSELSWLLAAVVAWGSCLRFGFADRTALVCTCILDGIISIIIIITSKP